MGDEAKLPDGVPPREAVVSDADLDAALRVFAVYSENPPYKAQAQACPRLRELFDLAKRTIAPSETDAKAHRKRKLAERRDADHKMLEHTGIRKMRQHKLVGHAMGSFSLPLPPRELKTVSDLEVFAAENDLQLAPAPAPARALLPAATPAPAEDAPPQTAPHEDDDAAAAAAAPGPADTPMPDAANAGQEEKQAPPRLLNFPRSCHICPNSFRELHFFYDQLCPSCADFNFAKRDFAADMRGRVCIVTGARVKIGYCIALKLLRMGAIVVATTRFPHDAASRFAKEHDFASFGSRLNIYGIDFRDVSMVHQFCRHIRTQFTRLDVIINNAAQTVRKPPIFYQHLMEAESSPLPRAITDVARVVDVHRDGANKYAFRAITSATAEADDKQSGSAGNQLETAPASMELGVPASSALQPLAAVNSSAALSQIPLTGEDIEVDEELFPKGQLDRDDQQIDLRSQNSWTMEIGQISTVEMLECHVINAFAPWILISELKPFMEATRLLPVVEGEPAPSPDVLCDKYIVNVSAMEGQFYRPKTIYHPHSNMAKASLNMLTRTSAAGLAAVNIFMTAVDTGWITDENPVDQWDKRTNAPPPLDEWDAAMRVLDPVLVGVRGEERHWGVFLKNYFPTRW
ncbi:hypothetical protein HK105_202067 [Polyrhizophydium stewartii]|uniref:Oxidoreductase n=1 Tax=Polyrhizophydium stewartii TaxID=2732419 RepID=A0ABR4NF41_9FUNG|nr:hypothetical protein HK105_002394 [Polyrhizophydium stewartii]